MRHGGRKRRQDALPGAAAVAKGDKGDHNRPSIRSVPPKPAMNAPVSASATVPQKAVAVLRTLVVFDLVDSTALVERLGDQRSAQVFRHHDRLVRGLIREHGGQEVDKTDGFLLMFDRPIQAVAFALDYQRALRRFAADEQVPLAARTGIHVGDVVTWHNSAEEVAAGAKPVEVEGLVKPVAARLMGLALPGQILLSGVAYSIARRAEGEIGAALSRVQWLAHGRFRFKGVPEAVPVHEVGETGIAPLKAPAWTGKAHRELPLWRRPAMLALEAAALVLAIALPLYQVFKPQPAIAFIARDWVVVADLHNLTGEVRFDESLQQAFRIGLEQSRHVNVLGNLQVRNVLERMMRDPDSLVDRETGAEIAMREGARALILPSVAEVGGRVRFTAEVIDPRTQATVWAESADGAGLASVLPSVDVVTRRLRSRLGEAIGAVSEASEPLEKAATANLDALRAYSLARRAYDRNENNHAIALMREAINMDPGFALARLWLAVALQDSSSSLSEALDLLAGLDQNSRLAQRDRLRLEGVRANLTLPPEEAMGRWRRMAELYPDDFQAHGQLAYRAWLDANDLALAVAAVERNAVSQNPNAGTGHYMRAMLALAQGDFDTAERRFELASAAGLARENEYVAYMHAARGDPAAASAALAAGRRSGQAISSIGVQLSGALLAADRGNLEQAAGQLAGIASDQIRTTSGPDDAVRLASLYLDWLRHGDPAAVSARLADAARRVPDPELVLPRDRAVAVRRKTAAAWLATRVGDAALARALLDEVAPDFLGNGWPDLDARNDLARARLALLEGRHDLAIGLLEPHLDGTEFWLHRQALAEALYAAGRLDEARAQIDWLLSHRHRAWAEVHGARILHMAGVLESRLVHLLAAEQELAAGHPDRASTHLEGLLAGWPESALSAPLLQRVQAVRSGVDAAGSGPTPVQPI